MSTIYFKQRDGEECGIRGSERAWFSMQVFDLFMCSLSLNEFGSNQALFRMVWREDLDARSGRTIEDFRNWARAARWYYCGEEQFDAFSVQLNTAIAMGSDVIRLAARIHAQCEVHGYFDDSDRPWLKKLIEDGLSLGIFRTGQGWEPLLEMIGEGEGEIVMHFSVTDGFPGDRPWEEAMQRLKENGMRICPDNLGETFTHGINGFQLAQRLRN
jgi:hypothetical protein